VFCAGLLVLKYCGIGNSIGNTFSVLLQVLQYICGVVLKAVLQ
jgi:hypothetical protein